MLRFFPNENTNPDLKIVFIGETNHFSIDNIAFKDNLEEIACKDKKFFVALEDSYFQAEVYLPNNGIASVWLDAYTTGLSYILAMNSNQPNDPELMLMKKMILLFEVEMLLFEHLRIYDKIGDKKSYGCELWEKIKNKLPTETFLFFESLTNADFQNHTLLQHADHVFTLYKILVNQLLEDGQIIFDQDHPCFDPKTVQNIINNKHDFKEGMFNNDLMCLVMEDLRENDWIRNIEKIKQQAFDRQLNLYIIVGNSHIDNLQKKLGDFTLYKNQQIPIIYIPNHNPKNSCFDISNGNIKFKSIESQPNKTNEVSSLQISPS